MSNAAAVVLLFLPYDRPTRENEKKKTIRCVFNLFGLKVNDDGLLSLRTFLRINLNSAGTRPRYTSEYCQSRRELTATFISRENEKKL